MKKLIWLLLFLPLSAFGQGVRYENHPSMKARADGALVATSATVAVCIVPINTTTTPCSTLATLYTDATLSTPCTGTLKDGSAAGATNCSNPLTTDSKGNYHFYASGTSTYTIQVFGSGLVTTAEPDIAIPGSLTGSITGINGSSGNPWIDPTSAAYGCKGDDATDDTACMRAAIAAVPRGGALYLPPGKTFLITCGSPVNNSCLNLTYPIQFFGAAMGTELFASVLRFPGTVSNATDLIHLTADNNGSDGYYLHDFSIQCNTVCARSAINIDTTSFPIARLTISRVGMYGGFGSFGIRTTNPAPLTNGFFVSTIGPLNIIRNGILLQNAGDSISIVGNDIPFQSAAAEASQAGIDATYVPGAQQTTIAWNNITQTKGGCMHLGSAARNTWIFANFCEGGVGATDIGSNGALIDLDGVTGNHVIHAQILNNVIQSITTNIDNIRVNFADATSIHDNTITRPGGTAVDVRVTANATNTLIDYNRYEPTTDTLTNILADSGTQTQYRLYGAQSVNGIIEGNRQYVPDGSQSQPSYAFTSAGNTGWYMAAGGILAATLVNTDYLAFATGRVQINSANGYAWSSGGATAASNDTGFGRGAAGVVTVDTGTVGNALGVIKPAAIFSGGAAASLTGTGACATFSTQTGGAMAGRATCTGATAASTLTITPGKTAPNGWVCYVQDQTTRANLFQQTATVAASCTLTATSVTQNDVFVFTAIAF